MWCCLNLFAGIQISTTHSFPVRVKKRSPIPKPNPQMFAIWLFVLVRPFGNKHLETKAERVEMDGNRRMAERGDRRKRRQGGGREGGRGTVGTATESAQPRPQELQTTLGMGRCPLTPPQPPPAGCDWHLKTAISLPRGPKKQLLIKLIQRNRVMGSGPGEKSPRSMALAGDSIALLFSGKFKK